MVPVSTACFDPHWFHDWMDQDYVFKDKRGIYNGIRAECFHFDGEDHGCGDACFPTSRDPSKCDFLRRLRDQYDRLDFQNIMNRCERLGSYIQSIEGWAELPILVFIFYETPINPCSERKVLQNWFKDNGYNLEELKYPIKDNYVDF
jgi:hypothetical protein